MAKWEVGKGIEEYISKLEKLTDAHIIGRCVYEGAKVVADSVNNAIDGVPNNLISDTERQGLHDGLGVSHMKNNAGYLSVRVGFGGTNSTGKKSPWNTNAFVANRVSGGTSHQAGYPFITKAVSGSRQKAEDAMKKQADIEFEKAMK